MKKGITHGTFTSPLSIYVPGDVGIGYDHSQFIVVVFFLNGDSPKKHSAKYIVYNSATYRAIYGVYNVM